MQAGSILGQQPFVPPPVKPAKTFTSLLTAVDLLAFNSDAQVMGSKRMVELFLSSRRNRIAGNVSERSVSGSSAAFI